MFFSQFSAWCTNSDDSVGARQRPLCPNACVCCPCEHPQSLARSLAGPLPPLLRPLSPDRFAIGSYLFRVRLLSDSRPIPLRLFSCFSLIPLRSVISDYFPIFSFSWIVFFQFVSDYPLFLSDLLVTAPSPISRRRLPSDPSPTLVP